MVPSRKTEPLLSGNPEPLVASRHDLASRARSGSTARGGFVFARSGEKVGMWHDDVDTGGCRSANEFDDDRNRQLTTAETSARLGYCPRQDVRSRRRSSSRESLAKWIRAWGSAEPATDASASWHVERCT